MKNGFSSEVNYFIYVIRCAVKGETPKKPQEAINWKQFVSLAKKQEAYSLVAAALPSEYLPAEESVRLHNYEKSELVRLIAMKSELTALEGEMRWQGIRFMLLKGARIKEFYPKESMRQMSDIDILYDETARDALLDMMKKHGYKLYSWSENSDDFSKKPYYTFEFHRRLFFDDFGFDPDFSFVWDNAVPDEKNPCKLVMRTEDVYLHSVAHMYKHYRLGGFGIRFLADTYLMLKGAQMDTDYIALRLADMGLTEFEKTVRELAVCVMEDGEYSDAQLTFLSGVMEFGLYGDMTQGRAVQFEQFKARSGSDSMVKYTLSRLFPDREYMHRTYRVLDSAPFLLPYFYVQRLITKTFSDGGKAVKELKDIKKIQKKDK